MFKVKLRKYTMIIDGWIYERWNFIKAKNDLLYHLTLRHVKPFIIAKAIRALAYIKDMYDGVPESEVQKPEEVNIEKRLEESSVCYSVNIKKDSDDWVFFTVRAKEISHV